MRKLIVLLAAIAMLLGAGLGIAGADIVDSVDWLQGMGLESSAEVNQTYVDLSDVSSGSVTSVTYSGIGQTRTDNSHNVLQQTIDEAHAKIAQYVLDLNIQYSPDSALGISGLSDDMTVSIYTYGAMKNEITYAVVDGLEDCLGNPPIIVGDHDSDDSSPSWVDKYTPSAMASKAITSFKIGEPVYITTASSNSESTLQTMDVSPEIVGDRTFVPVRYLAYSLGVPEEGVTWEQETQTVTIETEDATIELTIGSTVETVNSQPVQMDVSPYIRETKTGGRTMLPARWIAEPLGAAVGWDEATQQVTIEISQEQGQ